MKKKILYVDMDGVLVDFKSGINKCSKKILSEYKDNEDEIPGIFGKMEPMPGALESYKKLSKIYDTYILSTAPWKNETALVDKLRWVKKHLGEVAHKRLILTHHKNLNKGDYLIDDRDKNGVKEFDGKHLHFGEGKNYPDWESVVNYLKGK